MIIFMHLRAKELCVDLKRVAHERNVFAFIQEKECSAVLCIDLSGITRVSQGSHHRELMQD